MILKYLEEGEIFSCRQLANTTIRCYRSKEGFRVFVLRFSSRFLYKLWSSVLHAWIAQSTKSSLFTSNLEREPFVTPRYLSLGVHTSCSAKQDNTTIRFGCFSKNHTASGLLVFSYSRHPASHTVRQSSLHCIQRASFLSSGGVGHRI